MSEKKVYFDRTVKSGNKAYHKDKLLKVTFVNSIEEGEDSIEKLINARPKITMRGIMEATELTREKVVRGVSKLVDEGKAQIDGWKEHNGIDEAQLVG